MYMYVDILCGVLSWFCVLRVCWVLMSTRCVCDHALSFLQVSHSHSLSLFSLYSLPYIDSYSYIWYRTIPYDTIHRVSMYTILWYVWYRIVPYRTIRYDMSYVSTYYLRVVTWDMRVCLSTIKSTNVCMYSCLMPLRYVFTLHGSSYSHH